jgi:hypothetical protein
VAVDIDYENNGASGARHDAHALKGADKRPRRTQRENRPSLGRLKKLPTLCTSMPKSEKCFGIRWKFIGNSSPCA